MQPSDLPPAPPEAPRDGATPDRAVVVYSVAEEYAWMRAHHPGFAPKMQTLGYSDGRPYDVLTWQDEHGAERTVYFDISAFFGRGGV